MRNKNYSFGKIAEWLGERLGRPINKGGVFRIYQNWEEEQNYDGPPDDRYSRPPDDEEEADSLIQDIADAARSAAEEFVSRRSLPESWANEGVLRAAKIIEQELADERAAEAADAAKTEKEAGK